MNIFYNNFNITRMQQVKRDNIKKLGNRIYNLRVAKGLTVNEIAMKYGGISVATWSRLENGVYNNVDFSTLIFISKAFDITIIELLDGIDFDYTIEE